MSIVQFNFSFDVGNMVSFYFSGGGRRHPVPGRPGPRIQRAREAEVRQDKNKLLSFFMIIINQVRQEGAGGGHGGRGEAEQRRLP